MNNEPMPKNCITLKAAAQQLCMPQKKLRQFMRENGWLQNGKHKQDHNHNQPTRLAIQNKWLQTQTRGYPAPYNKEVTLSYEAVLFTQQGLIEMVNQLNKNVNFILVNQPAEYIKPEHKGRRFKTPAEKNKSEDFFNSAEDTEEAHKKALEQLSAWGILDKAG
jgi:Phage antirepressor protein KilAC domain